MKHFGNAFQELLFRSGTTQKSIGEKLGFSHVTITRWKELPSIDAAQLEQLCRIFHVPINYFFDADVCGTTAASAVDDERALHTAMLEQQVGYLQKLLEEKERTIQLLLKQ